MNKRYAQVVSLDRFNNGEPTIVVDVLHHTMIVDGGTEFINGEWVEIRSSKHYLSGEVVERLYELEEKATPKLPKRNLGKGTYYKCPICESSIGNKSKYCKHCGQRIKWEKIKWE